MFGAPFARIIASDAGTGDTTKGEVAMSADKNKELAERFHGDIFQQGNLDVADEIIAPGFVIHSPGYPPEWTRGPEGTKQLAAAIIAAFPDRKFVSEDVLAEGDEVLIRWSMSGTHQAELMGVPATGRPVSVTGFDLFRISRGKIAELWQNWDQLGLLQQVGAVPSS
jgi:steroid delta-isomerase-like uncharacterized protein